MGSNAVEWDRVEKYTARRSDVSQYSTVCATRSMVSGTYPIASISDVVSDIRSLFHVLVKDKMESMRVMKKEDETK
jgi:hypothetical protein